MRMQNEIFFHYLDEIEIDSVEYQSFFEKFHGKGSFSIWNTKMHWYFKCGAYKVLVAILDGNYVGQSSGYMAKAMVNGEIKEIWWSVDTFVLKEMRGKSIGKQLQNRLHQDLPNFSSISYSNLNGIIKKKCGAKECLDIRFTYYPISCYFTLIIDLAIKKAINRNLSFPKLRLPYFYPMINHFFYRSNDYDIEEIPRYSLAEDVSGFMEQCLKDAPFHVVRSIDFLKWKYTDNPILSFHAFSILRFGERIGVIILSDVYKGRYLVTQANLVKILDFVVKKEYQKDSGAILEMVLDYCRERWSILPDGILSAQLFQYKPSLLYPKITHMLSTLDTKKIESGYVSYIDQDMERMY